MTITTTGRPVWVGTQADGGATASYVFSNSSAGAVYFYRDSTQICRYINALVEFHPSSAFWFIDTPGAGTYTYSIKMISDGTHDVSYVQSVLVAFELS